MAELKVEEVEVKKQEALTTIDSRLAKAQEVVNTLEIITDEDLKRGTDYRAALKDIIKVVEDNRTFLVKPLNEHVKNINAAFKPKTTAAEALVKTLDGKIIKYQEEQEAIERKRRQEEQARIEAERKAAEDRQRAAEADRIAAEQARKAQEAEIARQMEEAAKNNDEVALEAAIAAEAAEKAERIKVEEARKAEVAVALETVAKAAQEAEARRLAVEKINQTTRTGTATTSIKESWDFEIVCPGNVDRAYCSPDEKKIREGVKNGVREMPGVRIFIQKTVIGRKA